jgi:hypothetical protein
MRSSREPWWDIEIDIEIFSIPFLCARDNALRGWVVLAAYAQVLYYSCVVRDNRAHVYSSYRYIPQPSRSPLQGQFDIP